MVNRNPILSWLLHAGDGGKTDVTGGLLKVVLVPGKSFRWWGRVAEEMEAAGGTKNQGNGGLGGQEPK